MSLLSGWMDDARRSYCAYGADLIRTGCLLLRTTPSVTYRATVLFQRFQAVAEDIRRKRGDYQDEIVTQEAGDGPEPAAAAKAPLYTLPARVGTERPSGILVLGDLYAPLDYCVFYLRKQDDIAYLTAACVLIAAKIEDPSTRIRLIVGVFMRLNQRRRGEPVIELLQPPPERYDDFKVCVLEAEELVLHALGFQTFVESPFKYAILFLGMLIQDDNDSDGHGNSDGDQKIVGPCSDTCAAAGKSPCVSGPFANVAVKKWLADAVCWLNDIPRSTELYVEEAYVLALCALFTTRPSNVVGFPDEWTLGFGVDKAKINALLRVHHKQLEQAVNSENNNIQLLIAMRHKKPNYPTAKEEVPTSRDVAASVAPPGESTPEAPPSLQESKPAEPVVQLSLPRVTLPVAPLPPMVPLRSTLETLHPAVIPEIRTNSNQGINSLGGITGNDTGNGGSGNNINHNHRNGIGVLCSNQHNSNSNSMPLEVGPPVVAEGPILEEFHFEDLKDLQRRWRQEEEQTEKKRVKRRRSSSRRKRHRSTDRRRHRSGSHRREESPGGKKRRRAPSTHRSHRGEQHQQQQQQQQRQQHSRSGTQQSRGDRRDDKSRHEARQRNDGRHQRRRR